MYREASNSLDYYLAGTVLGISCLTDMVDGQIARHFHMISHVGKILDPMADKFTQLALILCLLSRYPLLYPLLMLFLVKELFQLFAVILHFRHGKALPGALMAGKVCTAFLFVSLIALVLFPNLHPAVVDFLVIGDALFLTVSFIRYVQAYYGKNKIVQDWNKE